MPRRSYIRVFKDKELLLEMLHLAGEGMSYVELGIKYHVDHTSIIHQCKKYGVSNGNGRAPKKKYIEAVLRAQRKTVVHYLPSDPIHRLAAEPLTLGMPSYRAYVKNAAERRCRKVDRLLKIEPNVDDIIKSSNHL